MEIKRPSNLVTHLANHWQDATKSGSSDTTCLAVALNISVSSLSFDYPHQHITFSCYLAYLLMVPTVVSMFHI